MRLRNLRHDLRLKLIVLAAASVLITIALPPVIVESHSPISPYGLAFTPHEHGLTRDGVIRLIWPGDNPIDNPASYPVNIVQTSADTWRIEYEPGQPALSSRIRRWDASPQVDNCWLIYHEGHAPNHQRTPEGLAVRDFFLARGCNVIYMDMPLRGINAKDQIPGLMDHEYFEFYDWQREYHQLSAFLEPPAHVIEMIYDQTQAEPYIVMAGRSGGGWSTLWYSALDPRIDAAVIIAGFWARSMRDRVMPDGLIRHGDYEQSTPDIYGHVSYEDIANLLAGRKVIAFYATHDPCCFSLPADDPWVTWLGQRIDVYVDGDYDQHGMSAEQFDALGDWLPSRRLWLPLVVAQSE